MDRWLENVLCRESDRFWLSKALPEKSKPRARKNQLRFRRYSLVLTLRRFRTAPAQRSKRFRQYIVQPYFGPYREVALALHVRRRRSSKWLQRLALPKALLSKPMALTLAGLLGSVIFGLNIHHPVELNLGAQAAAQSSVVVDSSATPHTLPHATPVHITIPKIGIDTSVISTGLKADGSLALPNQFDVTAWYAGGPAPGDLGPAVIAGHVDSTTGIAIFWRLRELAPGDQIQIARADGSVATFTVIELQQYDQEAFPTEAVYGNINYAGLRLITCGGTFNTTTHHYDQNTVVYARLNE
jgi:sortase (surface protein transpeptidase)